LTKTCSTQEAAERLGVSHRTVQLWVESGHLLAWKTVGGHRRILISSLDEFLNSRYLSAPSKTPRSSSLPQKVVFVCDSDANMRALFRKYTDGFEGVKWKFFKSNLEALLEIGDEKPNIFISEICSSGVDVRHLIITLSNHPISCSMKVVLTSDLSKKTLEALNFGPEIKILKKPFSSTEFISVIENMLQT
jgi:excisionase family DNA binding protein